MGGVRVEERVELEEEVQNKLKGAFEEKVPKCGLKVETGMSKVRKRETGVAESEQVSKTGSSGLRSFQPSGSGAPRKWEEKRSSRLRNCKGKRRSRSGLWEVIKKMTSRESKLLRRDTAAQVWNVRKMGKEMGSPAGNLANVERVPCSQKVERGKLRNGSKHKGEKETLAQGSSSSALKTKRE